MNHWFQLIIKMRWLLVAALVAFSSVNVHAADAESEEARSLVDASEAAPGVTVSAILTLPPVVEVVKLEIRSAKKQRLAKKKVSPTIMLTRTERRQVALLAATTSGSLQSHTYNPNEEYEVGIDELVLHRSFSRPKVVADPDDDENDALAVSEEIGLRLLMARLKAVEAHVLNQVADTDEALPESVQSRLAEARLKAVAAHQKKFA